MWFPVFFIKKNIIILFFKIYTNFIGLFLLTLNLIIYFIIQ